MTEAMLAVGSGSQLEFCTRAAGVEVLLSLAERAPAIMRKCPTVAPGLLPLALVLACEVRKVPLCWSRCIRSMIFVLFSLGHE